MHVWKLCVAGLQFSYKRDAYCLDNGSVPVSGRGVKPRSACPPSNSYRRGLAISRHVTMKTIPGNQALACILTYAGLSLCPRNPTPRWRVNTGTVRFSILHLPFSVQACLAGAIVLLIAFWFDGGLFTLATGAVFWIVLESRCSSTNDTGHLPTERTHCK